MSKEGKEFDKCFTGMAIGAHSHMWDMMTVYQKHVSGDLAKLIDDGRDTTERHLDHAKKIMKELEGSATAKTARSDTERK